MSLAVIAPPSLAAFAAAPFTAFAAERTRPSAVPPAARLLATGEEPSARRARPAAAQEGVSAPRAALAPARPRSGEAISVVFGDHSLPYLAQKLGQESAARTASEGAAARLAYDAAALRGRVEFGLETPLDLWV